MPRDVRAVVCLALGLTLTAFPLNAFAEGDQVEALETKPVSEMDAAAGVPLEDIGYEDDSAPSSARKVVARDATSTGGRPVGKIPDKTKSSPRAAALDAAEPLSQKKSSTTASEGGVGASDDRSLADGPQSVRDVATTPRSAALRSASVAWLEENEGSLKLHEDDVAALKSFYGDQASGGVIWINQKGLNARGRELVDVLRSAGDWGLDVSEFDVPDLGASGLTEPVLVAIEAQLSAEALRYARHARGGRLNPRKLSRIIDQDARVKDPAEVITQLGSAASAKSYLLGLHPQHPQFEKLRQKMLALRKPAPPVEKTVEEPVFVKIPGRGKALSVGQEHADVALLRKRLKVKAEEGEDETVFDEALARALKAFQKKAGIAASGRLTRSTRRALNRSGKKPKSKKARSGKDKIRHIVMNMERWRWMPEDLGKSYVWNNIPEFYTRVMRGDEQLWKERIIVGLPDWATPVFSADMKFVIFNPSWGMPNGIKARELKPRLKAAGSGFLFFGGGGASVIRAYGLKVYQNGREINPDSVNWVNADLRKYSFVQPPGAKNPLGIVKFRFPNKHNVYMHDTIEPELFGQSHRAKSHGCIRVRNPRKFAALMIQEGNSVSPEAATARARRGGNITLDYQIPVHMTYFTAVVDQNGKLRTFGDLYGHDRRLSAALFGRALKYRASPKAEKVALDDGDVEDAPVKKKKKRTYKKKKKKSYAPATGLAAAVGGGYGGDYGP